MFTFIPNNYRLESMSYDNVLLIDSHSRKKVDFVFFFSFTLAKVTGEISSVPHWTIASGQN